ncbi:MAG TPA: isoprenyl transferase [candidate division WOR-3 bacterium]|uniref:Isoprenyl transferase n=1 Tax=candidate division WOR-3 bacterium TaxID=2052148 RepID=A0A9C9ENN9_UNCW3|nr:isoprenyl transferase [candidate division WOR-3 bacterium]
MQQLKHVAIIMDGNGRWARKRALPRVVGHRRGVETVRRIVKASRKMNIKFLTLYTFSTENWKRPKKEVDTLMAMLEEMLIKETPELHENQVRINAIGRLEELAPNAKKALDDSLSVTRNNKGLVLTLCLNYGGQSEIVDSVKKILLEDRKKHINLDEFDEKYFARFLYDPQLPEPELLIRTGAEKRERVSNFLLWQIAYTEIYFTKTLWPDFKEKEYIKAIESFKKRERLFGAV